MKAIKNGATAVIFDISEVPQAIKQVFFFFTKLSYLFLKCYIFYQKEGALN